MRLSQDLTSLYFFQRSISHFSVLGFYKCNYYGLGSDYKDAALSNEQPFWPPLRKHLKEEIEPCFCWYFFLKLQQGIKNCQGSQHLSFLLSFGKGINILCRIHLFIFTTQNIFNVQSLYRGFPASIVFMIFRFLEGLQRKMCLPKFISAPDIHIPLDSWVFFF